MMRRLRRYIASMVQARKPDFVITDTENGFALPYMLRWYLLPRNKFFNAYVHCFLRSDKAGPLHDHPWLFNLSWILENEYTEQTILAGGIHKRTIYREGDVKLRFGPAPHRVELHNDICWTLFVTGPVYREWGFYCEKGFVPFKQFTIYEKGSSTQKGCGD